MSVRAYKIIKIEHEKQPTFNCWQDHDVLEIAEGDSEGLLNIQQERAEEKLASVRAKLKGLSGDCDDEQARPLRELETILCDIIKDCGEDGYADYFCF